MLVWIQANWWWGLNQEGHPMWNVCLIIMEIDSGWVMALDKNIDVQSSFNRGQWKLDSYCKAEGENTMCSGGDQIAGKEGQEHWKEF